MKKDFRKKVIELRKKQSPQSIIYKSKKISDIILSLEDVKKASTIMIYLDFNNEVKTDNLVNSLISLGKKVLVPITIKENKTLVPSQIKNINTEVSIGTYGIREPKKEFIRVTDIESIDVLIVPAVAFDINRFRLGYGGGFYDRFIEKLRPDSITIGIAFEFQVFDSIPKESHDAQLNYIVTEERILK
ncbi:5-formyltetrahydrofolate cyclo-ligase [Paraclostridium bifermentans]|uniref:5-formyltetrahydrofolate cyclo-ligase n=1 Tax=Paraclostridium bifermentans TaxID=1490 RepID=UPI0034DE0CDB